MPRRSATIRTAGAAIPPRSTSCSRPATFRPGTGSRTPPRSGTIYAGAPLSLTLYRGRRSRSSADARPRPRRGRAPAAGRAGELVADGAEPRRLDAGRLHRGAGLRLRRRSSWPQPGWEPEAPATPEQEAQRDQQLRGVIEHPDATRRIAAAAGEMADTRNFSAASRLSDAMNSSAPAMMKRLPMRQRGNAHGDDRRDIDHDRQPHRRLHAPQQQRQHEQRETPPWRPRRRRATVSASTMPAPPPASQNRAM